MFIADTIIDTVQTGKKTIVNTFVTNETVKDSMIKFIDSQAEYTKRAAKVGMDTFTTLSSEAVKQVEAATKYDYVKAGQEFFKAFQPTTAKK
jgi:ATP phosphoribosyltransferase